MNYQIDLKKSRQYTREELEKFQKRLNQYRDHLYNELRKLNGLRVSIERRDKHLKLWEDYFCKQERRLLVVAIVVILLAIELLLYIELGNAQFRDLFWLSSAAGLGLLFVTNLLFYLLDKFGMKEQAARGTIRILVFVAMSPVNFLKLIVKLIKNMLKYPLNKHNSEKP